MNGVSPVRRKYVAVRSRVIGLVSIAPMFILYTAVFVAISVNNQSDIGLILVLLIPLLAVIALVGRTIYGLDVRVQSDGLTLRSMWRTRYFPRDSIKSFSLDDGRSSAGLSNLVMINMHLQGSDTVPLKVFNSFKPKGDDGQLPLGFQRIKSMTADLNRWIGESASPAKGHEK
jgi:hypothetical protein